MENPGLSSNQMDVERIAETLPADTETDAGGFSLFKPKPEKPRNVSVATSSIYYDMNNLKRGVALIFNHYQYDNKMPARKGTEVDCSRIKVVLSELDFDVQVHHDLKYSQMSSVLEQVSKMDHTDHDCLVVVIMSHGEEGRVHARDRSYPVSDLWCDFVGDKCKSLIGKPKLFFIQACRGEEFDDGVQFSARNISRGDSVDSVGSQPEVLYTIPKMADLLVMYSTYEGHFSWRNPSNGSWFIQALCDELVENGRYNDILTLLTGVTRRVAYQYQSYNPENRRMDGNKQIPCITTMLTKILFFTPKRAISDKNLQ